MFIAIWRQSGERRRRLRLLTGADDKSSTVTKVATERLGTGLRVLRQRAQGNNGQPVAGSSPGPHQRAIPHTPLVAAMHSRGCRAAARTHGREAGNGGLDHHTRRIPDYPLDDHVPQVRKKKIETAPDSATRVHIGQASSEHADRGSTRS